MEYYKTLCQELIEEHIEERISYETGEQKNIPELHISTREEVLKALLDDTENVFGNIDGSRTCNTYEAQQFIDKSGAIWDDDIHQLFEDCGLSQDDYFFECLKRGAETLDVVILELLSNQVINEMLEA